MDLLNQFEKDQKILNELKELLTFAPPNKIRRSLEDLIFHCFSETEEPGIICPPEMVTHFYYLINFLNEVEETLGRD